MRFLANEKNNDGGGGGDKKTEFNYKTKKTEYI